MPTPPKAYSNVISLVDSLVHNPSRNFLTDQDYVNYMNMSAIATSNALGGLRFTDRSLVTVLNQYDYTVDNQYRRIDRAWIVHDPGLSTEVRYPLTHLGWDNQQIAKAPLNNAELLEPNAQFGGYYKFDPANSVFTLLAPWAVAGDTLELRGLGDHVSLTQIPDVTYDGDTAETLALVYKFCHLARLKSRETNESGVFEDLFDKAIIDVRAARSRERRQKTLQDGRFVLNPLRSLNGAR